MNEKKYFEKRRLVRLQWIREEKAKKENKVFVGNSLKTRNVVFFLVYI